MSVALASHGEYMETEQWRVLSRQTKIRDRYTCQACGHHGADVQAHHHTYPKCWGDDRITNLTTLCPRCHRAVHAMLAARRA